MSAVSMRGSPAITLLAAALSVAACREPVMSVPTTTLRPAPLAAEIMSVFAGPVGTIDDETEALASVVPGLGGIYIDSTALVVFLTDTASQAEVARRIVPPVVRARFPDPLPGAAMLFPLRVRQGRFDFRQLARWYRTFLARRIPEGLVFSGIDNNANALTFGVKDAASRGRLVAALQRVGVPDDAYSIEISGPFIPLVRWEIRRDSL